MRALPRLAATAVALAVGWGASVPCPPAAPGAERTTTASVAHSHLSHEDGAPDLALTAPCRCGCGGGDALARPGARLGFALERESPRLAGPAFAALAPARAPAPPAAPQLGVDPVPV